MAPPHTAWGGAKTQGGGAVRSKKATIPHNREKCLGELDYAGISTWFGEKNFFFLNSEHQLFVYENNMITKYISNDRKTGT